MTRAIQEELAGFLAAYPDIQRFDLLLPDINGILRGVRASRDDMHGLFDAGTYMSASTMLIDSRGVLPEGLTIGSRDGDPDYCCLPVSGTLAPVPWARRPAGQCLLQMYERAGIPYHYDSRYVLQRVLQHLRNMNLTPVVALELEFYFLDDTQGPRPEVRTTRIPGSDLQQQVSQLHSLDELYEVDAVLADIESACEAQRVPIGNIMSEASPGQYEINLHHVDDAELACDHALLLRRLVRGVALRHELAATFMAKPFTDLDGSGMHMHVSLLDADGRNVFAGKPPPSRPEEYAPELRHAIGGLQATMSEARAILAPNANSYRRFSVKNFASSSDNWGANHRHVAIRIPPSNDANVRFEHRTAGADCNPYLALATVLAGMHYGLTQRIEPSPMIREAEILDHEGAPAPHWEGALSQFEAADILPAYLGEEFCRAYAQCRRMEAREYQMEVPDLDYHWYLKNI